MAGELWVSGRQPLGGARRLRDAMVQAGRMPDFSPALSTPLELAGACNVRDLGGYETASGQRVRTGQLLRGDSPHRLTDDDLVIVGNLGLRTVVDLRSADELQALGEEPLRSLGVETLHIPLRHAPGEAQVLRIARDGEHTPTLAELYRGFVDNSADELARIVTVAADSARRPLLFHCLAGKDRTGVVAAFLLTLLGVPDELVAADYAATAAVMPRFRELTRPDRDILGLRALKTVSSNLMGAEADTMLAFLQALRDEHGGAEQFLTDHGAPVAAFAQLRTDLLTD
jgi:protein-tyrosine phosphatase